MMFKRSRLAVLLSIAIAGCNEPSPTINLDVSLKEPTQADVPDSASISDFQRQTLASELEPSDDIQWPFLFGPNRTGASDASIVAIWPETGPTLRWETPVGTGYGSPVTAENRVVFSHRIDDTEWVQCHDASNGTLIWKYGSPTQAVCDFEYSNGPYSTPLIDQSERSVYHFGGTGTFTAIDFDTGERRWERELHEEYKVEPELFPAGATPLLDQDQLILALGGADSNAGIVALRTSDGQTNWTCTEHKAGYTTPIVANVHGQRFAFVMTAEGLVSLNPDSGEVDWEIPHRSRAPMSYNSVSPLVLNDLVLAVTGPGPGAICVKVHPDRSHSMQWKNRRLLDSQYTSMLLSDNHVYGFTSAGQGGAELRCIDFATGKLAWKYHSVLRRGQGLIAGDAMIFLGERGHLASMQRDAAEAKLLSFTKEPLMQAECYCSPAIVAGGIVLKDENRVAVYDSPLTP